MGINPRNRFKLKVADAKLFLFAIRQLSSNVCDDTASILFIDCQQEMLSMLTMHYLQVSLLLVLSLFF